MENTVLTTSVFIGGKQIGVNCLRHLLARGIRPAFVVANLDDNGQDKSWHASLVKVATEAGLETITGRKVRDPEIVQRIVAVSPEIVFCLGGMQIIPKEVLDASRLGTLNIHPALLPKYRGRFSTVHAIFNGEHETGVTVHWMSEALDAGPIIMQEAFPITDDDTGKMVYDKFTVVGSALFERFLDVWLSGAPIPSTPQDESRATYYPKGLPNDGRIDWSWDGKKIRDFIRAMTFEPFPPVDFMLGEKKMVIVDSNFFHGFE